MIKLYDHYRDAIKELGAVKRAWFTSFNFSCPFFESYLLPPLIGSDKPRNIRDFEILQKELTDQEIEVTVWADAQYLDATEVKRTSFDLIPINMDRLEGFSSQCVFHPKVILLQNEAGDCILGTGSANLSTAAWAHNTECYTFEKIESKEQFYAVKKFFDRLGATIPQEPNNLSEKGAWQFIHSFQNESFWKQFSKGGMNSLEVVSPYFSKDLSHTIRLMTADKYAQPQEITIIPDFSSGKMRARTIPSVEGIHIKIYRTSMYADQNPLLHAKVWRSDSQCAIGSWNFTRPAMGIEGGKSNNVEAGILYQSTVPALATAKEFYKVPIDDVTLQSETEHDDMPKKSNRLFPFDVSVSFDWEHTTYTVTLSGPVNGSVSVNLPDTSSPLLLTEENRSCDVRIAPEEIYKKRLFHYDYGTDRATGVIKETGLTYRNTFGFETLSDLFDAYGTDTLQETSSHSIVEHLRIADNSPGDAIMETKGETSVLSYFKMFQGFKGLRREIERSKSAEELHKKALVYQGNLKEMKGKIEMLLKEPKKEGESNLKNGVLHWFLIEEYNGALELIKNHGCYKTMATTARKDIKKLSMRSLDSTLLKKGEDLDKRKAYLNVIRSKLSEGVV